MAPFSFGKSMENNDVYICLCNGVRQSQIEDAIQSGLTTLEQLQDQLEVATNCGACTCDVVGLLRKNIPLLRNQ